MAKAAKTHRNSIVFRPGLEEWFSQTRTLYNRVVAFYFEVYEAHPLLLELSAKEALTKAEQLTHTTARNPHPIWPLVETIEANIPAMLRRAAINAARGAFKSFQANRKRWLKGKEKFEARGKQYSHRPPVPPRSFNFNMPWYGGMYKERTRNSIMLRMYSGQSWQWVKLQLKGDPLPGGWQANSPVIIRRGRSFRLHTPLEKQFKKPEKAIDQVAHNPALRVCSIDLNLGDAQAVGTIVQADGTEVATRFIRGGRKLHARRRRLLGQVAMNRRKTGVLAEGEQDNKKVWHKIRALEDNEAHRVSRRIVEFALAHDATILVFEHLQNLKPHKGRYSKRSNDKRAYWLKGRIVKYARYKAWEHGLLTCMVSPAFTSQDCAECGQRPVARYAEGQAPIDYHPGGSLFLCPNCLKRGHADRNASVNIGLRFFHRSFATIATHLSQKPLSKDEGVQLAQDAAGLGGLNGPALPAVSLAQLRLNGSDHAAGTGERVYAGVP